jgi:hypothetical protein
MARLGALSDEMTPVLTDLGAVAPDVNRLILQLGPFSQAALPAFDTLGEAAKVGIPAVKAARPVVRDLRQTAEELRPVAKTASALLTSFQRNDGIQRAMDYILYQVTAINGMDGIGHYLRAELIVNQCASYSVRPIGGCSSKFSSAASSTSAGGSGSATATRVRRPADRTQSPLRKAIEQELQKVRSAPASSTPAPAATPTPTAAVPAPAATPAPGGTTQQDTLLDYLFGSDG